MIQNATIVLIASLMAGCGGGGNSSETTSTGIGAGTIGAGTTTDASIKPALFNPMIGVIPEPQISGENATNAQAYLNYRRALVGLNPLTLDSKLQQAAQAHANYIVLNSAPGHYEVEGKQGFTGISPSDRTKAAGYSDPVGEGVSGAGFGVEVSIDSLIDAPYHRFNEFAPAINGGHGIAIDDKTGHGAYVFNVGYSSQTPLKKNEVLTYPINGQSNVKTDWFPQESPNPLPDIDPSTRVGYPISIQSHSESLTIDKIELKDDNGGVVESRLITKRTDDNSDLKNYAFIIPLKPLSFATKYNVHATGQLGNQPLDATWAFTTIQATPLVITKVSTSPDGTMTFRTSGGTGNFIGISAAPEYSYTGANLPEPKFAIFNQVDAKTVNVTLQTPCTTPYFNCRVHIIGKDSVGTVDLYINN